MLVIQRTTGSFHDDVFENLPNYLRPQDCLVLNNTRVFPARLHGRRNHPAGAEVEVFLTRALDSEERTWEALVRPGKRVRTGDRILFAADLACDVLDHRDFGERTIRFETERPVTEVLEELGTIPLPPYIHRLPDESDRERYQTIFAQQRGSVAAPTAGLHFTPEILRRSQDAGAALAHVTLHVGLGTFAPLRAQNLEEIHLHQEHFRIEVDQAEIMKRAHRLVCVGTTSVRALESAYLYGGLAALDGETSLFIRPGFRFQATGAMITNFHLPQSSLLMLVCAFAGRETVLAAYQHAVSERYRFFSYGDCMLIV